MTKKERFKRLVEVECIVCRKFKGRLTPAIIHHLTGVKYRSTGKKASYKHTIPLCNFHHVVGTEADPSVHSHPELFEQKYGPQEKLLELTNLLIDY